MTFLNESKFFDKIEYIIYKDKESFILSNKTLRYSSKDQENAYCLFLKILNLKNDELNNLKQHIGPLMQILPIDKKTYKKEIYSINKAKLYMDKAISNSFYSQYEVFNIACELNYFKAVTPQQYHNLEKLNAQINKEYPMVNDFEKLDYIYKFYRKNKIKKFTKYEIRDFEDFIVASISELLKCKKNIKKCENCSKYFIAGRSDTTYCKNASPQNSKKTCSEYMADKNYNTKLSEDEATRLYRKIYKRLQKDKSRNPYGSHVTKFEDFTKGKKEWDLKLKNEEKTKEEYLEWLKEQDSNTNN